MLTVRFIGPIRRPTKERTLQVDTQGMFCLGDLLRHFKYSEEEMESLYVLLDGKQARIEAPLDRVLTVDIMLPMGGG